MKKMGRRKWKVGTRVDSLIGRDHNGQYWWLAGWDGAQPDPKDMPHGPFATQAEAEHDFHTTIFGPQCEIKQGGMWNPNWDKPQ
jgi:hypothetical protein